MGLFREHPKAQPGGVFFGEAQFILMTSPSAIVIITCLHFTILSLTDYHKI